MQEAVPEPPIAALTPLLLVLIGAGWMAVSGLVALALVRRPLLADRVGAGLLVGGSVCGLAGLALWFGTQTTLLFARGWSLPWGRFSLVLDGLSAAFLFPLLAVPALAAIYSTGYWAQAFHGHSAARARVFIGFLAASLALVPLARDAVLFLMAFEVMTLSAFFLITTEDHREDARSAGWAYFVASHVSLMLLFAAFAVYRASTGTFELSPLGAAGLSFGAKTTVFLLVTAGFGIKAGIMPLHVWLPGAHAAAPSHVSAVLSGVVIKVGIYGLLRVTGIMPDPSMFWGLVLLLLGAVSGVVGVAYAIGQHDLKRLLAYHSIENIGIIIMGMGAALLGRWGHRPELVVLGLACAVMHVWNHALFKSLLFLSAGSVVHAVGTREIDRMGALGKRMPWSAGLFALGAVAICGLPPLNGFISEFFLYTGAVRSLNDGPTAVASLAAPALALIGGLACACFIKVVGCVFLGQPRTVGAASAHECGWSMRVPMMVLGGGCVLLGLVPSLGASAWDAAASAWLGGGPDLPPIRLIVPFATIAYFLGALTVALLLLTGGIYAWSGVRRAPHTSTWACGYAAPTARMQYTSSSVAQALVRLFAFVLRPADRAPTVLGAFPPPASYEGHVDDVTLQRVVSPLCRGVADRMERVRHMQTGRIQVYIVYILITTLCLLLFVVPFVELLTRLFTE